MHEDEKKLVREINIMQKEIKKQMEEIKKEIDQMEEEERNFPCIGTDRKPQ